MLSWVPQKFIFNSRQLSVLFHCVEHGVLFCSKERVPLTPQISHLFKSHCTSLTCLHYISQEKRTSTRTLTLLDYKLAFVALASGVGAAGVALLLETSVHAANQRLKGTSFKKLFCFGEN